MARPHAHPHRPHRPHVRVAGAQAPGEPAVAFARRVPGEGSAGARGAGEDLRRGRRRARARGHQAGAGGAARAAPRVHLVGGRGRRRVCSEAKHGVARFVLRPGAAARAAHRRGHGVLPAGQRVRGCGVLRPAGARGGGREERALAAAGGGARGRVQDHLHRDRAVLGGRVRASRDAAQLRGRGHRVARASVLVPGERGERGRRHRGNHARGALPVHDELLARRRAGDLGGDERDLPDPG
mmetsp:Transcript_2571/g.10741  ORF Transcript_2571/g.10741 Transcript_2571/m.10741 type:complete len:240 (+) Transcript_2571:781-1500(+)